MLDGAAQLAARPEPADLREHRREQPQTDLLHWIYREGLADGAVRPRLVEAYAVREEAGAQLAEGKTLGSKQRRLGNYRLRRTPRGGAAPAAAPAPAAPPWRAPGRPARRRLR